jgi:hypothetical protein
VKPGSAATHFQHCPCKDTASPLYPLMCACVCTCHLDA